LTENWNLDDLSSKTVLVIGEDGIGDEILTIGCLHDLMSICRAISWKCDQKLKALFTRSFPCVKFITEDPQSTSDGTIYSWELVGRLRKQLKDFPGVKEGVDVMPYLRPSAHLRDTLSMRYHDGSEEGRRPGMAQ
jgi:hypothetical protein